jgi:hypothetical protein
MLMEITSDTTFLYGNLEGSTRPIQYTIDIITTATTTTTTTTQFFV